MCRLFPSPLHHLDIYLKLLTPIPPSHPDHTVHRDFVSRGSCTQANSFAPRQCHCCAVFSGLRLPLHCHHSSRPSDASVVSPWGLLPSRRDAALLLQRMPFSLQAIAALRCRSHPLTNQHFLHLSTHHLPPPPIPIVPAHLQAPPSICASSMSSSHDDGLNLLSHPLARSMHTRAYACMQHSPA
eukprot:GGOE01007114.1.p1 GENE.GGOE01007114.1~~GGOE01007114.1.p1  ORF type:complete len:184 (-),score=3.96 GGOE01007114.1:779-1330(-)